MFFVITLHYITSYLEWLKYKTIKPLLYTMYRTRNRKTFRKEIIGKTDKF